MPNVTLHFYAANDLNGDVLLELTDDDDFLKSVELKVALSELGGGSFRLARKVGFPLFPTGAVQPDVLCRVLVHAFSDTEYFWAFFINKRAQVLVGKEGSEEFQFGGPGPKLYLDRGGLGIEQFTGAGSWHIDLDAGVFRWNEDATAGRVLNKVINEDAANPASGCPDLTKSFTAANDSDGNPWVNDVTTAGADDFELPIGTSILKALWELEDIEDIEAKVYLGTVADPVFRLDALPQLGVDYTASGTGYGADVLRFLEANNADYPAGNIGSLGGGHKLTVEGQSTRKVSHVNVKGKDGAWAVAIRATWSPGEYVKWATISYPRSSAEGILERAGTRWLRAQEQRAEEITIPLIPGDDDTEGRYFPVPDDSRVLWVGNTASFHTGPATGASPLDYRNEQFRVTRIDLELVEASDDTDALTRALSWQIEVSFNTVRGGSDSTRQQTTGRGTPGASGPKPCIPGVFEVVDVGFIGALGEACSNDSVGHISDYAPWGGDPEEYVEITSAEDVPAGGTILVGVSANRDGDNFGRECVVYDEQGNVYELDVEGNPSGTSDVMPQTWRSVLTTPIVTGDYIRFAWRGNDTSGGRCLAASAWDGALTLPEIGSMNTGFNGTPTIPDSPVAGVSFLTMASFDDGTITGDADWTNLDPYVAVSGSGSNASGLLTEYLQPGEGDSWAGAIDQSRNWSVVSVGYSAGGAGATQPNDGNPDLVGEDDRYARCDHRHDVHRDTAPTVDDDWATQGYKIGTLWAQLDDLTTPTEIVALYIMADDATGAAVWLEVPTGGGSGAQYFSRRLVVTQNNAAVTITDPNTTYLAYFMTAFYHDWDQFPATHFMITAGGQSSQAGQTISMQLAPFASPTNPVSAGGDDLVVTNTVGLFTSGWIAVSDAMAGIDELNVALKGSNSTVDFLLRFIDIAFKIDP